MNVANDAHHYPFTSNFDWLLSLFALRSALIDVCLRFQVFSIIAHGFVSDFNLARLASPHPTYL